MKANSNSVNNDTSLRSNIIIVVCCSGLTGNGTGKTLGGAPLLKTIRIIYPQQSKVDPFALAFTIEETYD